MYIYGGVKRTKPKKSLKNYINFCPKKWPKLPNIKTIIKLVSFTSIRSFSPNVQSHFCSFFNNTTAKKINLCYSHTRR